VILRALPAGVVEDLYEIIEPTSPRNPFRDQAVQWRNYLLVALMLHLGLRRGEPLVLLANAVKRERDPASGEIVHWINVIETGDEIEDVRADPPSTKTVNSVRQLPVSADLAALVDHYVVNIRGRQRNPHLFLNRYGSPLSLRFVNKICNKISHFLSEDARRALDRHMRAPVVRPHDLRHTCAVMFLAAQAERGEDLDLAEQRMRCFFGWSEGSRMPRRYARGYYESALARVWNEKFGMHVDILRRLDQS
jgi:integrase